MSISTSFNGKKILPRVVYTNSAAASLLVLALPTLWFPINSRTVPGMTVRDDSPKIFGISYVE